MSKVLIVSTDPLGQPGGNGVRLRQHVRFLSEWFDVKVVSILLGEGEEDRALEHTVDCRYETVSVERTKGLLRAGLSLPKSDRPFQVALYDSGSARRLLRETVTTMPELRLVVAHLYRAAGLVRAVRGAIPLGTKTVVDMQDCLSGRFAMRADMSRPGRRALVWRMEAKRLWAFERRIVEDFDTALFTTADDQKRCGIRGAVLPICVEMGCSDRDRVRSGDEVPRIVLVGDMAAELMAWSAERLVRDIMPEVWREHPDVEVRLVGARPCEEIRKLEGSKIVVTGFVENLADEYCAADIAVYPLRYGSGVKVKVLEAMACGLPVVTNSVGNQGLGARDGQEVVLCETTGEFRSAIDELLSSPEIRESIGNGGRTLVRERFSPAKVRESYRDVLACMGLPRGGCAG